MIGRFNERLAVLIDKANLGSSGFARFFKVWILYIAFVSTSVIDFVGSFLMVVRFLGGVIVRAEDQQKMRLQHLREYGTLMGKNAVAIMSLPFVIFGLISAGAVTSRFLPDKPEPGVHAGGNLYHAPSAALKYPEDTEALSAVIQEAARHCQKVTIIGAGFSQGKQFLPGSDQGIVIDLKHFNTIEIHSRKKTAIVGAGVRWGELQKKAEKFKLAIQVMQASNVFSVGGSIGTNVHGWRHTMGSLSNTILSMEIMNAQGKIQSLTPEDSLFHAITGGMGLVGIVLRVKLQLTDDELLLERSKEVSLDEYDHYFQSEVLTNDKIRMHLCRLSIDPANLLKQAIAVDYILDETPGLRKPQRLVKEYVHGNRFDRIATDFASDNDILRAKYWKKESRRILQNRSEAQTTNAIMQPPVNAMFTSSKHRAKWLQEYFLPGDKLVDYVNFMSELLTVNKVILLNASLRYIKRNVHKDRKISPLAYAHDADRYALVLCWDQSLESEHLRQTEKWIRESQHVARKMGGTFYNPYQHISSLKDFDKAYPHADEFRKIKQEVDPDHLFVSGFYQKYLAPRVKQESHIRAIMKSEASKNAFAGFLDTVLQRVDSSLLYPLVEDILKYKDTDSEVYEELCNRLPEIMPNTLSTLQRVLNSLTSIKEDLGEQAAMLLPDVKNIDGLVEIGYPGRFVGGFRKHFKVTGQVTVVLEQLAMTDYLQTGFPAPYDQFEKLDYKKPHLKGLKDKSADIITCYIGLHHFPESELKPFLKEIRRVLRPGGHFLLVDHDVSDSMSLHYAHGAHTFFNAVHGVSLQEEITEIRNFRPMSYWRTLLEEEGLGYSVSDEDVSMIRKNDPSRNRMVSFQKPGLSKTTLLSPEGLKALSRESLVRPQTGFPALVDSENLENEWVLYL